MYGRFVVLFFILGLGHLAVAETESGGGAPLKAGVEAGMNFGSLSVSGSLGGGAGGSASSTTETFLAGGPFMEIGLSPYIALRPQLMFMPKYTGLKYLAIQPLVKGMFAIPETPVKVFGLLGPDLGIRIQDDSAMFSQFDIALDFGAGVEYAVTPTVSLIFDLRYSLGLSNVFSTTLNPGGFFPGSGINLSASTRGILLMFGVGFSL